MKAKYQLTCHPAPAGGICLKVSIQTGREMFVTDMPFDRDAAARLAADVLRKAGITRAAYESGVLTVLEGT